MKRVGALLLAAALIVGALLVNDSIHDNGSSADDEDDPAAGAVDVVCATEFREACESLADGLVGTATFRIESPGRTSKALVADPVPTFDLWLTSAPWPELTAVRSDAAGSPPAQLGDEPVRLAQSAPSFVARSQRIDAIASRCEPSGGAPACVFDTVGTRFADLGLAGDTTTVKLGIAPVDETAGLLALAWIAVGYFPDANFDAVDIEVNDEFRSRLAAIEASTVQSSTPLASLLTLPRTTAAIDLAVDRQLAAAADGDAYATLDVSGAPRVEALALAADSAGGRAAIDRIGRRRIVDALTAQGWSTLSETPDNLPAPSVLDDLVRRWSN